MTTPSQEHARLGRYRLLRKIARGGMAEVFAARSFGAHGFEKTVAIKRILDKYGNDPQFVRMMVDEAKITVLLNHPNVAQILELSEHEGDYFIVMEFVPGQSLSALRKQLAEGGERVPDLEACFITTEILQGLHAAHVQRDAAGKLAHIIHRDVSPQNVLVSFDGHVKVIDFGIARARHRLEMTEVGTIKGKLRYLAPEMIDPPRFMKSGDFDHRVDVFAAGIVLWELIASRTLYQGEDDMAVYDAITDSDAPNLHDMKLCDEQLARIVAKALTRNPEERFLTAEAFADELRTYLYRRDPAFTHKRVAALVGACFPLEKEEMLALERGVVVGERLELDVPVAVPRIDDARAGDTRTSDKKTDKRVEENREDKPTEDKPAHEQRPVARPEPIAPDAPTRTAMPAPSASGGGARRSRTQADTGDVLTVLTLVSRPSDTAVASGDALAEADSRVETETAHRRPRTTDEDGMSPTDHSLQRLARAAGLPVGGRRLLLAGLAAVACALAFIVVVSVRTSTAQPAAPAPERHPVTLRVASSTPGAQVSVAGVTRAPPAEFRVLPGDTVDVVVRAPGYDERFEHVQVPRTDAQDIAIGLDLVATPAPLEAIEAGDAADAVAVHAGPPAPAAREVRAVDRRPGKLKVTSRPVWALVSIDGKAYGETPIVAPLAAGRHRLVVTQPDREKRFERVVVVRPGETTVEAFELD